MPASKINGWYGWRPDKPDLNDHKFLRPPITAISDHVDLRANFPPCYDQGDLGSCTANAIAGAIEFDQLVQKKKARFTPSRLFIYYNERAMEGTIGEDAGAEIRDGIKSVNVYGAPREKTYPYLVSKFARKPTAKAFKEAQAHQALRYERLDNSNLDQLLACLTSGFPFVFGFSVYPQFEGAQIEHDGMLEMPKAGDEVVGGHAVLAVGYNKSIGMFIVRNSWGADWGDNGHFWMPFDYITNKDLADDFWVMRQIE